MTSAPTLPAPAASAYFSALADLHTQCGSKLRLEPGADEATLGQAEERLGVALDAGLRSLWQHANGERSGWATVFARPGYFTGYSLLSVNEALAGREGMRQRNPQYVGYEEREPRDPRIAPGWFKQGWLPFAAFGGATLLLLVDASPGPGGRRGQIISFTHDPDAMGYVAASMEEFLAGSLQMLQGNLEEFIEPEDE